MVDALAASSSQEAILSDITPSELIAQQQTVSRITHVILNNELSHDEQHKTLAEMHTDSDYGILEWRNLHMFAIAAAKRLRSPTTSL